MARCSALFSNCKILEFLVDGSSVVALIQFTYCHHDMGSLGLQDLGPRDAGLQNRIFQGRINRLKKDWEKDLEDDEDDDVTFDRRQKEPRNDSRIKKCHVLVIYFLKDGPKACARVTLSKHLHRFLVVFVFSVGCILLQPLS